MMPVLRPRQCDVCRTKVAYYQAEKLLESNREWILCSSKCATKIKRMLHK